MSKFIILILIIFASFLEAKSKEFITEDTSFSFTLCDKIDNECIQDCNEIENECVKDCDEKLENETSTIVCVNQCEKKYEECTGQLHINNFK